MSTEVAVDIKYPEGRAGPWIMDVNIDGFRKKIPVYHCREDSQKERIARHFARGDLCVAFGVGNYGTAVLLDDPRRMVNPNAWKGFFNLKPTRELHDKVPIFIPPKDFHKVVDFDAMHPEFAKFLRDREQREKLWRDGVVFHLVAPVPDNAHYIHPILITTTDDLIKANKPPEQMVPKNTASVFWWHDPDWEDIVDMVTRYNPFGKAGISSFNDHREQPAYTFEEVVEFVLKKKRSPFDFVVRDEVGESVGVKSSHPQFRIPLRGEPPEWIVIRHGSISIDGWLKATNSPFGARVLSTATVAARATSPDINLDELVFTVRDRTLANYQVRHKG
ncbi:MAG: hypothetical protein Q8Q65_02825 [bacterium]|nr:hypothetical protein [bacterium]